MMDIVIVVVGVGRMMFGLVVLRMAVVDWPSDAWLSSEMSVFLEMRYRWRFWNLLLCLERHIGVAARDLYASSLRVCLFAIVGSLPL
jgi:hypothetical protein